jgi:hypothetical protein
VRYTFEYIVLTTRERSELSQEAESKDEAEVLILPRIADLEFTDESDIEILQLLSVSKQVGDNYIACEGCAS